MLILEIIEDVRVNVDSGIRRKGSDFLRDNSESIYHSTCEENGKLYEPV